MQSTLLGVAIAIILALVTALVAPLVVDWNSYRAVFEREASALTGLAVRVDGKIDARILPTPHLKLRDVDIGAPGRPPQMRAATVELEVGLGPLLRGVVQASEMRVVAPQINLALDRSGAIDWPAFSPSLQPDAFTVSRLIIENGRVTLADTRSGSRLVLQQLEFNGDVRSFNGPFKGDGAFVAGGRLYGYRVAANRADDGSGLKLRLGVDPTDYPLTADIDGTLTFMRGVPQFDGKLALARPAGAALAHGRRVMNDPWQLTAKLKATPAAATLQEVALQYGPEERAVNVGGKADVTFGAQPHFDGLLSARQIDLDRAFANPDQTHRPPLVMIKSFVDALAGAGTPPMPANINLSVDGLTVGGTTIQSLQSGIRFDVKGWSVDDLKFRAPGLTDVRLSGRLDDGPRGLAFNGPAALESGDLKLLMAWLEGRSASPSDQVESLSAHGDIAISSDRFALERLAATFEREKVEGRLVYSWGIKDRPAALDGELNAADLDVDAVLAFAKAAMADSALEMPHDVALALNIGKATFAGIDVRKVDARVKFDAGKLRLDRLSVGDLGGAALDVSGLIEELSSRPRGRVTLDLDASALAGLVSVADKLSPQAAASFRRFAGSFIDRLAPAKLHGVLTVTRAAGAGSMAKLDVAGQVGALRLALSSEADGEADRFGEAVVRLESRLDGDDGAALARLLGIDRVVAVDQLPGQMTISATGPLNGDLRVHALAAAGGFSTTADGTVRLTGEQAPSARLQVRASAADLRPLQRAMTGQPGTAAPIAASATLVVAGGTLSFSDLAVSAGRASVRGRLALDLTAPLGINGEIEADNVDAATAAAMLLGLPGAPPGVGGSWSAEPVGVGAFGAANGSVAFKLDNAAFSPKAVARHLKGVVRFAPAEIVLQNLEGGFAGGRLAGELKFRHDGETFEAGGYFALDDADATAVLATDGKIADGRLTLKLQGDVMGLSPAALVGSLHGTGTIALTQAHFSGIDAAVFGAATAAADQSPTIDAAKISAVVSAAMDKGRLSVPRGDADVTIAGGQIRVATATLQASGGGELSVAGVLDLNADSLDARMTLFGPAGSDALIPVRPELAVIIAGPLGAPRRRLDVAALMSWLALRGAERQTRLIESIEANRRDEVFGPLVHPPSPPLRFISPGTATELSFAPSAPAVAPGPRAFDRLHPEAPNAPPVAGHPEAANPDGASEAPARADAGAATAGTVDASRRRSPPTPAPPAPRPSAPGLHWPLDLLFGSQH